MSSRRLARAAAVATSTPAPSAAGYAREDDAVVCGRCGHRLPMYAGRHLLRVHDAWHRFTARGGVS